MKRFLFFALGLLPMVAAFGSCTKESSEEPKLSISVSEVRMSESGDSKSFNLTSNTSWIVTGAKGWLDVSPMTGEGNSVIVLKSSENLDLKERECTLTIATTDGQLSENLVVMQESCKSVLSVDIADIVLSSTVGSSATFKIISNDKWTIAEKPEWLELSSLSGSGDVTVTAKSLTTNYSSTDRTATLVISTSSESCKVAVSQKAAWLSNCVANPRDLTVLCNCAGFGWEFTDDVAYYYYVEIEKSQADRMTTLEVVDYILENGDRDTPGDGYINSTGYLYPNTEYILYTVAFNKDGVQGILNSIEFTTKNDNNQPDAYISNIECDWSYWYWETTIGSYSKAYYMWVTENSNYMNLTDGLIAYIVKRDIDNNPNVYSKILQSGAWQYYMSSFEVMIVTWGIGIDDEYSGYILSKTANALDDLNTTTNSLIEKKKSISYEEYKSLSRSIVRIN